MKSALGAKQMCQRIPNNPKRIGEMTFGDVLVPLAVLGVVILLWIAFR